jgi:hypothetical protein
MSTERDRRIDEARRAIRAQKLRDPRRETAWQYQDRLAAAAVDALAAFNFPPTVPVDESVVALVRLPLGVAPMYDIATVLDKHLGPGLVFRTDTGIAGWAVIARPEHTNGSAS